MILKHLLLLFLCACNVVAQESAGAWNFESPPSCNALNVTITFTQTLGQSDYNFRIDWGDPFSSVMNGTDTLVEGQVVSFTHAYSLVGSYNINAVATDTSTETDTLYTDTMEIDAMDCTFENAPPPVATAAPSTNMTEGTNSTDDSGTFADFLVTTDPQNISNTDQHFIARITDPATIEIARAEVGKTEGFQIIAGTIVKEPAPWNLPQWSFHLDPDTIMFADIFIEVCDANVEYVEENLAIAGSDFLPNLFWCPWSTRVLEELPSDDSPELSDPPSDVPSLAPSFSTPAPTELQAASPTPEPLTYVDFLATADRNNIEDTSQHFIVRITDLATIAFAREEIALEDGWTMVSGTIVKGTVDWNPNWSFHLAPSSIFFSSFLPESCDATIDYVEENLEQAGDTFLPDLEWCPWTSRILSEVEATEGAPSLAPTPGATDPPRDDASSSHVLCAYQTVTMVAAGWFMLVSLLS